MCIYFFCYNVFGRKFPLLFVYNTRWILYSQLNIFHTEKLGSNPNHLLKKINSFPTYINSMFFLKDHSMVDNRVYNFTKLRNYLKKSQNICFSNIVHFIVLSFFVYSFVHLIVTFVLYVILKEIVILIDFTSNISIFLKK